ncbi:hypothetical protein RD792_017101 [Penstemon davidsonii]|uniref:Uncharacterized protein n=1 Tax=Penstemon davidsonii TaxID=160366 RepID=A0ABR0CMR8_9LAMI|nr:hypothetical protein RD792_017101 [Penstemon davidsonii]
MAVNLESPKASSSFSKEHNNFHSKSDSEHPSSPRTFSNLKKIDSKLLLQLTFDTIDEVEHFFNAYGKELGFDVRRHSLKKRMAIVRGRPVLVKYFDYGWDKTIAGTILQDYAKSIFYSVNSERERLSEMNKQWMKPSFLSSKAKGAYPKSLKGVKKLSKMVEHEIASKFQDGGDSDHAEENECDPPVKEYNVRDPKKLMARGAPRAKPQHCGLCGTRLFHGNGI